MQRPLYTLGLLAAVLAVPSIALAQDAPDWLRLSSSAINAVNATDPNPDEDFFNVKGAPPSIMFILDSSGSMQELVVQSKTRSRPRGVGSCSDPVYDALGFDISQPHPPPDQGVDPTGVDSGYSDLFRENRFYIKRGNGGNNAIDGLTYTSVNEYSGSNRNHFDSASAACQQVGLLQRAGCQVCLATKGYFLGYSSDSTTSASNYRDIFSGKFLNFYPPKFVTARAVLKNVIWNTDRARLGLAEFDGNHGAKILKGLTPQCTAALNPDSEQWVSGRKALVQQVNGVPFDGNTPLAEALFDITSYFVQGSQLTEWFGTSFSRRNETLHPAGTNSEDRPICYGCQVSAVILISDGVPTQDGDDIPSMVENFDSTCTNSQCNNSYLDEIAAFFYRNDLQPPVPESHGWDAGGQQRVSTYTIGFGISLPLLEGAAAVAGGTYQQANDGTSLSAALSTIINDINKRATTAGSTSVASLQATEETTTLVPRFRPSSDDEPWQGFLYRFGLVNELTNGCVASGDPANPHEDDVDRDGLCNSIAYVDQAGEVVVEDPVTGDFVRALDGSPAIPHWEAGTKMVHEGTGAYDPDAGPDAAAADRRNLWTAVPDANGGWEMVPFDEDHAAQLMPIMGLTEDVRADTTCREIATRLGLDSDLDGLLETWGSECARRIISYYRGLQSTHPDPDQWDVPRPWLLGDIFHSSPIVVEAPVLPESCANFPSQCVASLWVEEGRFDGTDARQAYRDFVGDKAGNYCGGGSGVPCERRRNIALVGSNGGFLHAFDMGVPAVEEAPDENGLTNRNLLTGRLPMEGPGTGIELWGFMPPDLLGQLKQGMREHTYMVDGTAMVREVWVDGSGGSAANGKKDANEFRTVAVVGTGSGGSHYFALDVTESLPGVTSASQLAATGAQPKLLWLWPEPGSARVADMGQTFSNFFPRPPPIGPVLLESSSGNGFDFTFHEAADDGFALVDPPVKAEERWIVGLNGGVDSTLQRGRGFALVDVWTGESVWEQFWDPEASDLRKEMTHPIPAGLALMDIGSGQLAFQAPFDGYFDTLTVGDMGGNLWLARMHRPGKIGADGLVENWFTARAFQSHKDETSAPLARRRPITYLTSNALQRNTGYMRTFFGTGDRASLLDPTTGQCSLGNLQACVAMGCDVRVDEWRDQLPGSERRFTRWQGSAVAEAERQGSTQCVEANCFQEAMRKCVNGCTEDSCTAASGNASASGRAACITEARQVGRCGAACDGTATNNMGLTTLVSVSSCPAEPSHSPMVRAINSSCGQRDVTVLLPDPAGGPDDPPIPHTYETRVCGTAVLRNDAAFRITHVNAPYADERHRFVGAYVYGGNAAKAFSTAAGATAFDAERLTESSLTNLGTRSVAAVDSADPTGPGWYLDYDHLNERTASPAGMAASLSGDSLCVVWNSLVPGEEGAVCGGPGEQQAHLIQADFATGSATCLQDFDPGVRSVARSVIAAPPEPTPATVVGAGSITSGFVTTEPGQSPRFIRGFTNADPLQPIYQLELTNQEHQCRHTAAEAACGI